MVEVFRKENESAANLLRRFSRRVQNSGILLRARRVRFFSQKKSRRQRREDAIRRNILQREREWLEKLGKLEDE